VKKLRDLKLIVGTNYQLFIDPSIKPDFNGINLGVRKMKLRDKIIYKENTDAYFIFGLIFILLGFISSTLFYLLDKRKFK